MAEEKTTKPVKGQDKELKDYEFRLLDANEIECRVGQGGNTKCPSWCTLLIYKDARCDMRRLDEKFGIFGWKRKHEIIGGNLYCTVSVYKDGVGWVDKQDVGTPNNTEKEKSCASDAFKRACSCLGIGRELYTAPKRMLVNLNPQIEYSQKSGRLLTTFHVGHISYKERCISELIIQDQNNAVRYYYGMTDKQVMDWIKKQNESYGYSEPAPVGEKEDGALYEQKQYAYPQLQQAQLWEDVDKTWNGFPDLQKSEEFKQKCAFKKMELSQGWADLKAVYDAYPEYRENPKFIATLTQFKSKFKK